MIDAAKRASAYKLLPLSLITDLRGRTEKINPVLPLAQNW